MADEPREVRSIVTVGWTLETLLLHVLGLLKEKDERYVQRFESIEKAMATAFATSETLRAAANEFRGSMNDVVNTWIRRDEYNNAHQALAAAVDKLDGVVGGIIAREAGKSEGSKDMQSMRVWLIGLTVAVLGLLAALITKH